MVGFFLTYLFFKYIIATSEEMFISISIITS